MQAAVPQYMRDMNRSAPGHRFGLYFPVWNSRWEIIKDKKTDAAGRVLSLQPDDRKRMVSLAERQQVLALGLGDTVISQYAISTSPFVTGMGYEHPLENGFAFLNPYGLPYLPGSSVKGVLRRAAKELDVDAEDVAELFGSSAADGSQGALNFWDAFPQGKLALDVMTPHHGDYYQEKSAPHDSGQPNPIVFLTVAPEAKFAFHVQLIRSIAMSDWQAVLRECFEHAFDWMGFGAKTSVGYGAMMHDQKAQESVERMRVQAAETARKAAMTPLDCDLETWKSMDSNLRENAISTWVKRMQEVESEDALRIARALQAYLQETGNWLVKKKGARKERVQKIKAVLLRYDT